MPLTASQVHAAQTTVYAEEGCAQLNGRYAGQFATMLFADAARTKWVSVYPRTLDENEVVEDCYFRPTLRVTWEGRERPGTVTEMWRKRHAPKAVAAA